MGRGRPGHCRQAGRSRMVERGKQRGRIIRGIRNDPRPPTTPRYWPCFWLTTKHNLDEDRPCISGRQRVTCTGPSDPSTTWHAFHRTITILIWQSPPNERLGVRKRRHYGASVRAHTEALTTLTLQRQRVRFECEIHNGTQRRRVRPGPAMTSYAKLAYQHDGRRV